jgi:hypothetical protein
VAGPINEEFRDWGLQTPQSIQNLSTRPRDDVVDFEGHPLKFLAHLAIFAAVVCPLPHEPD